MPELTRRTISIEGTSVDDGFGQLDLALGGRAEAEALEHGLLHRLDHRRVAVAQDHRAPGADVVDVALAVGVPEVRRPGRAAMKRGVPPTALKARTGEFTPPGMHALGAFEQCRLVRSVLGVMRRGIARRFDSAGHRRCAPGSPSSSSSSSGWAQNKRSGTTLPMPGRKPASRQRSR